MRLRTMLITVVFGTALLIGCEDRQSVPTAPEPATQLTYPTPTAGLESPSTAVAPSLSVSNGSCTTVYDQPVLNANDRGGFSERQEAGGFGQQFADEFGLAAEAGIDRVSWSGSYWLADLPAGTTQIDFRIRFFNDDGGGDPELSPILDELVTAQVTNSGVVFEGRIIYFFEADLSAPFSASTGTTYWISVLEEDPSTTGSSLTWRWANSNVAAGDMLWFRNLDGTTWRTTTGDRANASLQLQNCIMHVEIDIKPGSYPNCFNNDGHGVIPVAILGSATFDVTQIDASTVSLAGLAIGARGKANKLLAHIEDANGDGFDDLVVQIEDVDGAFTSGTGTATLTGNLLDGTPFHGTDEICVVPNN